MEVKAVAKYIRMSPQKVRLVADTVRGQSVDDALARLQLMPKAAAEPVAKAIASAAANAEANYQLSREDLYIAQLTADPGPIRAWRRFGARGRFKPILRRTSHITVVLSEREATD